MNDISNKFLLAGDKFMPEMYLKRRTQSDKVLKDKAFKIADNSKYDGYQRGLASMVQIL